ncbi:hypothetical protein [Streptomyces nodosus]|uniref:hypothetical protein n=1 Tax=Streptomyces nodosus TaxID=40318 RepID=UPI00380EAFAA
MSDNQQYGPYVPHQADRDRVAGQNAVTDFTRTVEELPESGGPFGLNRMLRAAVLSSSPAGEALRTSRRTNFEGHKLNEMLDLVEQTNPADLESSGQALWDARDAIKAAAAELDGHIDRVHWVGESGEAFRSWGASLVKHADALGDFAGTAGDQISAAATGLASVRSAMPSRDNRLVQKRAEDFPTPERVETNDEYAAAVKVEKNRQEAINQMNRLSSYYVVSEEQLAALEPPKFESMPDVGVPEPSGGRATEPAGRRAPTYRGSGEPSMPADHTPVATGRVEGEGFTATPEEAQGRVDYPGRDVGTDIDSAGVLPERRIEGVGHAPSTVSSSPTTGDKFLPPPVTGYNKPVVRGLSSRGSGPGGARIPVSAKGKPSAPNTGAIGPARGTAPRVANPIDQARANNQASARGGTGQTTARGGTPGPRQAAAGRGISGGTQQSGVTPSARAAGRSTGAGRGNGVVGGKPVSGAAAPGKRALRVPRGTVVGGEAPRNGAPASNGRPSQRGVIGSPDNSRTSRTKPGEEATPGRKPQGSPEGVTGKPAARNSAARTKKAGFTSGGSGLLRRLTGKRQPPGRETRRSAGAAEDEGTQLPNTPRRDVPPGND